MNHGLPSQAVETPQVLNDILSATTGTAGRLRRGNAEPNPQRPARAHESLFLNAARIEENREKEHFERRCAPEQHSRFATGLPLRETSRSPRGLRGDIVQDLG